MRVDVCSGRAVVRWNDQGEDCELTLAGAQLRPDEQCLRDLYEALDFLFGRPGATK